MRRKSDIMGLLIIDKILKKIQPHLALDDALYTIRNYGNQRG